MSRVEVSKVLAEAMDEKPEAIVICYKVGNDYRLNIVAGIDAHYMRDLISIKLNSLMSGSMVDTNGPKKLEVVEDA